MAKKPKQARDAQGHFISGRADGSSSGSSSSGSSPSVGSSSGTYEPYSMVGNVITGGPHRPQFMKKKTPYKDAPLARGGAMYNIGKLFDIAERGTMLGSEVLFTPVTTAHKVYGERGEYYDKETGERILPRRDGRILTPEDEPETYEEREERLKKQEKGEYRKGHGLLGRIEREERFYKNDSILSPAINPQRRRREAEVTSYEMDRLNRFMTRGGYGEAGYRPSDDMLYHANDDKYKVLKRNRLALQILSSPNTTDIKKEPKIRIKTNKFSYEKEGEKYSPAINPYGKQVKLQKSAFSKPEVPRSINNKFSYEEYKYKKDTSKKPFDYNDYKFAKLTTDIGKNLSNSATTFKFFKNDKFLYENKYEKYEKEERKKEEKKKNLPPQKLQISFDNILGFDMRKNKIDKKLKNKVDYGLNIGDITERWGLKKKKGGK